VTLVHLLFGPAAGRARAEGAAAVVEATVRAIGYETIDITGTDAAESLAAARCAVEGGAARLVVVGGDGMVHLALQAVAGSDAVLGVVPVGTGNDFARGLGVDAKGAVEDATVRALDPPRLIDAIRTERGWVASVATAGFSGDVNARANSLRWPKGSSRYTIATLMAIPRLRSRRLSLIVDDAAHELDTALLAVANTAWFGGGMQICPDARPDDGQLDVTVVRDIGRISLLRYFPRVFSGAHLSHPATSTYRGRQVTIRADEELDVWGDGEPLGPAPITFTAEPKALRLAI
jgi:diacylglycerol kinase (ATP)